MKKYLNIVFLVAFASMWIGVGFQNLIVLFTSVVVFLFLVFIKMDKTKAYDKLLKIFEVFRFFASKVSQKDAKVSASTNNLIIDLTKPITKNKMITQISGKINTELDQEIQVSGKAQNSRILSEQSISYMIFSFLTIGSISVALGILVNPLFFLLLIIPPMFLFYPKIRIKFFVSERKSSIDDEMAFFTLYASVMQSIGQSLYDSITDVLDIGIFPTIEAEGKMLTRNVRIFALDSITALNELGKNHPNLYFKNMLLGYVSISRSGGDLSRYMERKSEEFFNKTQFKYSNYKNQANIIGETMLIMLSIFPTMILVSSFLMPQESVNTIMGLAFIVIPIITMVIYLFINLSQPKIRNVVDFSYVSIIIGIAAAGISIVIGQPVWFIFGIGIAAGTISNFIIISRQFKEISSLESALPDFFRDITEYRKIGAAIPNAIIKLAESRSYNKYFDYLLLMIASRLRHGDSLFSILDSILIRSWVAKSSFFVLGKISESGGGTPEILEQITSFSTNINQIKRETIASISAISYISLMSPVMMAYTAKEMSTIIEKLNSGANQQLLAAFNVQSYGMAPSEMMATVNLLTTIIGASIGIIMTKISNFTLKHTLLIGVAVLVAIVSILVMPYLPSLAKF